MDIRKIFTIENTGYFSAGRVLTNETMEKNKKEHVEICALSANLSVFPIAIGICGKKFIPWRPWRWIYSLMNLTVCLELPFKERKYIPFAKFSICKVDFSLFNSPLCSVLPATS